MPAFYPEGDDPRIGDAPNRSLQKINSLLKSIDTKTGSTTITGPVTVSNEVEVTNSTGNPIPVSGTVGLDSTSLAALENISVTFPATQNVNVTNAGLSVSVSNLPATQPVSLASVPSHPVTGTFWQATQPVSLASAPVTPVTDNGGSLTVDGTVTVNDMTSGNAKTKIVDSTGADVSYIPAGTAGTPSSSVVTVQGISGGEAVFVAPDGPSLAAGIQYQLDNNGPITRAQDVGDGIQYYLDNYSNNIPVYDVGTNSTNSYLSVISPNLGFTTDSVATTDTGTFSVISLIKRGMQNWTSLLAKIPALVSGRIPVDGSGVTQPISGTVTANNQILTTGSGTLPFNSAVDTDLISSIDASGFSEITVQFTSFPFAAWARFDVSNDNSTFVPQSALPLTTVFPPSPILNIASAGLYKLPLAGARYVRLRVALPGMSGTWVYSYTLNPRSSSTFGQLVSATTLPLPTGASSETTLSAVNTKIPSNLTVSSTRLLVDGSGVTQPTRETQPTGDYVINVGSPGTISLSGSAVSTASFDAGATADYVVVTIEGGGAAGGLYIDGSTDNSSWTSGQYLNVYYDVPSISGTDAYSYRTVYGQLFGATRSNYNARFIVSCTQGSAFATANIAFRYFRITTPATYGSWRYKFASYKSPVYSIGGANPGGVTRVNGRVDVGYVSNLPTLTATVTQATAANLNATVVGSGSFTAAQATASSLKAQAQILNSAGSLVTYAETGTYGSPSVDVLSVQNPQGVTATITTFTSTTASTSLIAAGSTRKALTVYNSGAGDLYISPTAVCTTTNFQLKLSSGDFWECPSSQVLLSHTAVFSTAGSTAYITSLT